jgi:hypothetical protein
MVHSVSGSLHVFVSGAGTGTWLFYFDWLDKCAGLMLGIGEILYEISNATLVCGSSDRE